MRETKVAGREALLVASELLQRARRADPRTGLWEAADLQWWWRKPRPSDDVEQVFWVDDDGPVAGVYLTAWGETWQCDPIVVPGAAGPGLDVVWARAREQVAAHVVGRVEVPVPGDDAALRRLTEGAGLVPGESSCSAWMEAADRAPVQALPDGFSLVDRDPRADRPHPMRHRNGDAVAERLADVPLYDASLDLAVETADGRVAGYSLYWFDPVTRVGLVEPVRVEDDFQRLGLARSMLTAGLDRLVARGAERIRIGYGSEAAGALYRGVGFRTTSTDTWYVGSLGG